MKHNVNIETVGNGWVVHWSRNETEQEMRNRYTRAASFGMNVEPVLKGSSLFTEKKKLIKELEKLL